MSILLKKDASELGLGDVIANHGVVQAVRRDGVFIVCAVRGTVYSLATGKGSVIERDLAFHDTNSVIIEAV